MRWQLCTPLLPREHPLLHGLHKAFMHIQQANELPNSYELLPSYSYHMIHVFLSPLQASCLLKLLVSQA